LKIGINDKITSDHYAETLCDLGIAYCGLSAYGYKEDNLKKSIHLLEGALNIYDIESSPGSFAKVNIHLGASYTELSEIKDCDHNLDKAKQAYTSAQEAYEAYGG
jgi:hypothetical protein